MFGAAALLAPSPAFAQSAPAASVAAVARPQSGQSVADFYKARKGAPLWLTPQAGDSAQQLISLLSTASLDGLSPDRYQPAALQQLVQSARERNKRKEIERADQAL